LVDNLIEGVKEWKSGEKEGGKFGRGYKGFVGNL
jgi:hypothetical protein